VLEPQVTTLPSLLIPANADAPAVTDTNVVAVIDEQSPPVEDMPQQTILPSDFSAAKALCELAIVITPLVSRAFCAVEGLPPSDAIPQVTTLPSVLTAAKASPVPKIFTTPDVRDDATAAVDPP
jgi:hypothetical protein